MRGQRRPCVAVDERVVRHRQGGQSHRVEDHRLVLCGDCQWRPRHGQRARDVADHVVGIRRTGRGDRVRVACDVAGPGRGGGQCGCRRQRRGRVAVDQSCVARRERGQCDTVCLGLAVGGDRQPDGGHGERARRIADRVVGVDRARSRDRVGATGYMTARGRRRAHGRSGCQG